MSLWQARSRPWLLTGWLWFVGALLPVIGLAQGGAQAWADRFSYWPHIGLFTALVWGLGDLARRLRIPSWACAAAALLTLVWLGWLTGRQVETWQNPATLWEHALALREDNHRAHACLGTYYGKQGRLDEAVRHLARAARLDPATLEYQYNLGVPLLVLGRLEEAAQAFQACLSLAPGQVDAYYNLGLTRLRQGQWEKALRCFEKVLEEEPASADALAGKGEALTRQGKRAEAGRCFQAALEHNPRAADAWHGLGRLYLTEGRPEEARPALERAIQSNPELILAGSDLGLALGRLGLWAQAAFCHEAAAHMEMQREKMLHDMQGRPVLLDGLPPLLVFRCRRAFALVQQGNTQAARTIYRIELAHDPCWPEKLTALAWKLLLSPSRHDPQLAFELVSQAIQAVDTPSPGMLAGLALAQAQLGQYRPALQAAGQALGKALAGTHPPPCRDRPAAEVPAAFSSS